VNHSLDGLFWPRGSENGTDEQPVVLLEVQMHSKVAFHHRLAAQSFRFLQQHPQVQHMAVVVVLPHRRLRLGPAQLPHQLQEFLAGVHWLSLKELGHQSGLHPLISLLTLPVLSKAELRPAAQRILQPRPDLLDTVVTILVERFPHLTLEEIMALINLPTDHLLQTRAAQDLIQKGEARGRVAEAAAVALRQLNRRCGPLNEAVVTSIQALPLEQLETLTDALLDFNGPDDLTAWLAAHAG
jgi:predicted transposase YdaD